MTGLTVQNQEAARQKAVISVQGAREHNLKNINVEIPRQRLVVVTGVSGSGKSTLAFDILFAEGQRRFMDCLNPYARQFIEQLPRPDVDRVSGLSPTVSIEQRTSQGGGKSTVATVTETYHYLRLLYAKLGTPWCPRCAIPVQPRSPEEIFRCLAMEVRKLGAVRLLAPLVRGRKGYHRQIVERAQRLGIKELRVDGRLVFLSDKGFDLDRYKEHSIEAVLGFLDPSSFRKSNELQTRRLVDQALQLGRGLLYVMDERGELILFSTQSVCPRCELSIPPLEPRSFSYNSPAGWCPSCRGFGELFYMPEGVDRGARADEIEESWYRWAEGQREPCPECQGSRLNAIARSVRLRLNGWPREYTIVELCRLPVEKALRLFRCAKPRGHQLLIARDILPEIIERLQFLCEVGLGYLQLDRSVPSLSGGEAQRIRLAAQLGSTLTGVLYVLDEPTIGLHARDTDRLLRIVERLRERGNSILIVEHDETTIRRADYIIDLGPGAGVNGGQIVVSGTIEDVLSSPDSVTGRYLREPMVHPLRGRRRPVSKQPSRKTAGGAGQDVDWLILEGAALHNLKNLTVAIPLQRLVVITGVSGSGKSTLVRNCLMQAVRAALEGKEPPPGAGVIVQGAEKIRAVHEVDQSPIGRTPRSVPATYVKVFDRIRDLFAELPEARLRGYSAGRFSFNTPEGRCPECQGMGSIKVEVSFLPPAYVPCPRCEGRRFARETLEIQFQGKNIAEVLELSVDEARHLFSNQPAICQVLDVMIETGLGYLRLGQPSPTLSGGEAQRIKLIRHLVSGSPVVPGQRRTRGGILFLLEEPTIGLHMQDVQRLIHTLHRLIDLGHSVVVIEHNLDVIAEADWVIDLGPEGGERGGRIVCQGPPEKIACCTKSHTGRFLKEVLCRAKASSGHGSE